MQSTLRTLVAAGLGAAGLWLFVGATDSGRTAQANARANINNASIEMFEQTGEIFGRVADVVAPAVVYIEAAQRDTKGDVYSEESGSGVVIAVQEQSKVLIVTNLHVVVNARPDDIDIVFSSGRRLNPVRVWSDRDTDLAVLDPGVTNLPTARLADSDELSVGHWVLAIGSPFGLVQSVTHGIVSATQRRQLGLPQSMRIKEFIQTDASINPGSSGGPLVNLRAEVVGINTAIASHTGGNTGVGFAIPSNIVARVVGDLAAHGYVRRALLGVEFPVHFTAQRAQELGMPVVRGALVASVRAGTPAQLAGIQVDDVILEFDGRAVEDEGHLINLVSGSEIGSTVRLSVWRDRTRMSIEVVLGDWNRADASR